MTMKVREALLGIQQGTAPDPHGWMQRIELVTLPETDLHRFRLAREGSGSQIAVPAASRGDAPMTDPTTGAIQPGQPNEPESVIAAGMAAGDTDAVMRAVATSEVVVPQAGGRRARRTCPTGSISLPVIEQDGTSYVPVFTSEPTMSQAAPDIEDAVHGGRRRARRQLAVGGAVARGQPRHRGRAHPAARRRPLAAGLQRDHRLTVDPARSP